MSFENVLLAFGLTLIAGLSTGLGGALVFFTKKTNTKFLSAALGFSAGVMIYVSMIEMMAQSFDTLTNELGNIAGQWATIGSFFAGMLVIALIDKLVPSYENPHDIKVLDDDKVNQIDVKNQNLMKVGVMSAFAIAIHNFPEGLATFISTLKDPSVGIAITIAVAIHNIPEGISVAIPIYYATGSKKQGFKWSLLSGLAEPIGSLIGFLVLYNFLNDVMFGVLFAFVAGIMVYISLDELLPAARKYGESHLAIYGVMLGMLVMAISLIIL